MFYKNIYCCLFRAQANYSWSIADAICYTNFNEFLRRPIYNMDSNLHSASYVNNAGSLYPPGPTSLLKVDSKPQTKGNIS